MLFRSIAGSLLMLASHSAFASWTLEDHAIALGSDQGGDYALIALHGGSSNSCIPKEADGIIQHTSPATARFILLRPAIGTLCFSAARPWTYTVRLPDPVPNTTYAVEVFAGDDLIGDFDIVISADEISAAAKTASIPSLAPMQGMWWSSDEPGTGLAFNVDTQGRWFGALYLYDDEGEPTFLTLQGDSLAYTIDPDALDPYAIGLSPVIRSTGGQCLKCPWSQADATDTGDDAELIFHSATRATLGIGAWSLSLSPLPMNGNEAHVRMSPIVGDHYMLMLDAPTSGRHVAVVKAVHGDGGGVAGVTAFDLECVDCRTVGPDGEASPTADEELERLVETEITFVCQPGGHCRMHLHNDSSGIPIVNKDASRIDVLVNRLTGSPPAPNAGTTHLQLIRLPDGWRD